MFLHTLLICSPFSLAAGEAPRASVHFPPPGALTDASTLHVTGTASDPDGVARVRVNGVDASTTDGFAHWVAHIPLAAGRNRLVVETADALGHSAAQAAVLQIDNVGPFLFITEAIARDTSDSRFFAFDRATATIVAVDSLTQLRARISGPGIGAGPALDSVSSLAVRHGGLDLIAGTPDGVVGIALSTGDRTVLSSDTVGAGPAIGEPRSIAYDAANDRCFALAAGGSVLLTVDLSTGARKIVSSFGVGGGVPIMNYGELVLDAAGNRLLSVQGVSKRLVAIDATTGMRTALSDGSIGSGPGLGACSGLAYDPATHMAYALLAGSGDVLAIDTQTGDRTLVATASAWHAEQSPLRGTLAFDAATGRVFAAHHDRIESVDPTTAGFEPFATNERGAGPAWEWPNEPSFTSLTPGGTSLLAFTHQGGRDGLAELDVATGDRRPIVADLGAASLLAFGGPAFDPLQAAAVLVHRFGTGSDWSSRLARVDLASGAISDFTPLIQMSGSKGIALDLVHGPAYVGSPSTVNEYDPVSNAWSTLSGLGIGGGPPFKHVYNLAYDAVGDRVLVSDDVSKALFSVDPATGDRSVLASPTVGTGPRITLPLGIATDGTGRRAFVADRAGDAVIAVDLLTLERRIVSKALQPSSFNPSGPTPPIRGEGPVLLAPHGLTVDPARDVVYAMLLQPFAGVTCIDIGSGDRVLLAR